MRKKKSVFPIITEHTRPVYPQGNICPICGKNKIYDPNTFIVINGGAMKIVNDDFKELSFDLAGFFSIHFFGAHDNGTGEYAGKYASVDVVKDSGGGQFDIHFCSITCLEAFFARIVHALRDKIEEN